LLGDLCLQPLEEREVKKGGIIIPDTAREKPQEGTVAAVGTGKLDDNGKKIEFTVKVGDKVRRGDVLGLLGNSGNSSEPHLHFQICNANSELGSEGLPYALPSFELLGHGWTWKSSQSQAAPVRHEMEIPLENDVVRFAP